MADIFRRHGARYRQKFDKRLLPRHHRALADIVACRTARCPSCNLGRLVEMIRARGRPP